MNSSPPESLRPLHDPSARPGDPPEFYVGKRENLPGVRPAIFNADLKYVTWYPYIVGKSECENDVFAYRWAKEICSVRDAAFAQGRDLGQAVGEETVEAELKDTINALLGTAHIAEALVEINKTLRSILEIERL